MYKYFICFEYTRHGSNYGAKGNAIYSIDNELLTTKDLTDMEKRIEREVEISNVFILNLSKLV